MSLRLQHPHSIQTTFSKWRSLASLRPGFFGSAGIALSSRCTPPDRIDVPILQELLANSRVGATSEE